MRSRLYTGQVTHERYSPKKHLFKYKLSFPCFDLDEIDKVMSLSRFWSNEKINIATFRRRDHLGDNNKPLKEAVKDFVMKQTGERPSGSVQLMTHPAYWGYRFNPVSFYFLRNDLEELQFIVAEINNTPWGEQFSYLIDAREQTKGTPITAQFDKTFHISPFFPMNIRYEWYFDIKDDSIVIHMENWQDNKKVFQAHMGLKEKALSGNALNHVLYRFPFLTFKVSFAIYWQALLLWLKGTPFYSHPKHNPLGDSNAH